MDIIWAMSSDNVSAGNCSLLSDISALYSECRLRVASASYVSGFGNPRPCFARGFFVYAGLCTDDVEAETES